MKIVQSRGYGKSWLIAICCIAVGILYPGSLIAVVSGTAMQSKILLEKITTYFLKYENVLREIDCAGHAPVQLSKDKGVCRLKNGTKIESYAIKSMRGQRAKILVSDEAPEVKQDEWDAIASPVKNTKRDICHTYGFKDFPSKTISMTSACLKSNYFYSDFLLSLNEFSKGNDEYFACSLDYTSAIRVGITDAEFFEEERKRMPESVFSMEYGSNFVGEEADSLFPYELTGTCRTLRHVEYRMPKNSQSEYIMSVDIATSSRKEADNTVISVIKMTPMKNGTIMKAVVYIRSYHGQKFTALADEIRRTYTRFPNTTKIVFDQRGLGDSLPEFFREPWVDPMTGREYSAWVCDEEPSVIVGAVPILRSIKANPVYNQQLASAMRVALERQTISFPISSRSVLSGELRDAIGDDGEELSKEKTKEELAIYIEADATQVEMGNIVSRRSQSGVITYDVAKPNQQHKDRYSSIAMGVKYISEIEEKLRRRYQQMLNGYCIGVVSSFEERGDAFGRF